MNDTEKIIVLLDGFGKSEAREALSVYATNGGDAASVVVAPVTELVAAQKTSDAIESIALGRWPGGTPRTGNQPSALIARCDKASAVLLMRSFKRILPPDSDAAFAVVTETGMEWTVEDYITHIRKEHNYMKTADPNTDPDMKEV